MSPPSETKFGGLSIAPFMGAGFLTDAKILNFKSPLPQGTTDYVGIEASINFYRSSQPNRVGELALMYYQGHASDHIDQTDLPLEKGGVSDLLRFSLKRESESHYMLAEWRWPTFAPVYRSSHWAFMNPQFGVGGGAIYIDTEVTEGNNEPYHNTALKWVVTGSTQVRMVEWRLWKLMFSLEGGIRMYAGQAFGIGGAGALRIEYNRFQPEPID